LAGLAADLDVYTAEDLLHAVDEAATSEETMRAVFRLTFAAHPTRADPAVVDRVTRAFRHTDPAVRAATAFAMANTDWAEYRPLLQHLTRDDDAGVRGMATRVLTTYDEVGDFGTLIGHQMGGLFGRHRVSGVV
jgi:HEAT repeat protein